MHRDALNNTEQKSTHHIKKILKESYRNETQPTKIGSFKHTESFCSVSHCN